MSYDDDECSYKNDTRAYGIIIILTTYIPPLVGLLDSIAAFLTNSIISMALFCCGYSMKKIDDRNCTTISKELGKLLVWPIYFTYKLVKYIMVNIKEKSIKPHVETNLKMKVRLFPYFAMTVRARLVDFLQ